MKLLGALLCLFGLHKKPDFLSRRSIAFECRRCRETVWTLPRRER